MSQSLQRILMYYYFNVTICLISICSDLTISYLFVLICIHWCYFVFYYNILYCIKLHCNILLASIHCIAYFVELNFVLCCYVLVSLLYIIYIIIKIMIIINNYSSNLS